jgi:hypothetical protein
LLKSKADQRHQIETDRKIEFRQEAEHRLRLEAAIRAVGLRGTPEGDEAAASQKGGLVDCPLSPQAAQLLVVTAQLSRLTESPLLNRLNAEGPNTIIAWTTNAVTWSPP